MTYMSITEFNKNISAVLSRVENGEEISLTRHGRAVAVVKPSPPKSTHEEKEAALKELRALMNAGFRSGGPATYEERTERG